MEIERIPSAEEFIAAYESILASIAEVCGSPSSSRERISLSQEQLKTARSLHGLVSAGDLKPDPLWGFSENNKNKRLNRASETLSFCDGFISDWEAGGEKSAVVQQLVSLLNRPHVRALLMAAEDISSCRYLPRLPTIPFEVDDDEGIAVKIVRVMKKDEPLGATIRCEKGRVVIARVIAGGVADRSACIQEGDRVLEVNGIPVSPEMGADDIVRLLNKTDNGSVTFKLVPSEIYHRPGDSSNLHVRALFDYNGSTDSRQPCRDTALSFEKGDLLELLVCSDQHWWQARCIGHGAFSHEDDPCGSRVVPSRVGLIPSEALQQRIKAAEDGRSRESIRSKGSNEDDAVYESVCQVPPHPDVVRPIVLVGPPGVGRNELKRRLLMLFPERFSSTIPHTTRAPRQGEAHGVDYYFVNRDVMENMITNGEMLEFGEYRGNLYGTALSAVHDARKQGIPLLTPHPLALRLLRSAELKPVIIFIQPPDAITFKRTRDAYRSRTARAMSAMSSTTCTRGFTDAEIDQIIEGGRQLDRQYGHLFDARIVNCQLEDSLTRLISLLQSVETKPTWMPLSWATRGP